MLIITGHLCGVLFLYVYDPTYQLTGDRFYGKTYSYDPVGNRNPLTQTYDSGNRLLDDGTYTYTYDLNGNMTSKVKKIGGETTTYAYNSEDQLIGVNGNISYKYDSLGRRIEKNVGGTITRYVYDGEDIIQELDQNNQVIAAYVHGPSIDEPIALDKAGQKYYYISDGLGSITALIDQNGNVAQTYRYDSFGNISSTGSLNQPYTYTGREYDPETGLYYYRARYYDPKIGRFLQEDPIGSTNLYTYCINNPLNLIDPFGLKEYIMVLESFGGGVGVLSGEGGIYSLIDPNTGETYSWTYLSGGVGVGVGGAAFQTEVGAFDFEGDPATIPNWSWSVSGFAAAIHGMSAQVTSPTGNSPLSLSPSHNMGLSVGHALGGGASISVMRSRSWYKGKGHILPKNLRNLVRQLKRKRC